MNCDFISGDFLSKEKQIGHEQDLRFNVCVRIFFLIKKLESSKLLLVKFSKSNT